MANIYSVILKFYDVVELIWFKFQEYDVFLSMFWIAYIVYVYLELSSLFIDN